MPAASLPALKFGQHFCYVGEIPVLGELAVFDAPNINGPECEGFARWGDVSYRLRVSCRIRIAGDHHVARNDAVLHSQPEVRHGRQNSAKILYLRGEARWASP